MAQNFYTGQQTMLRQREPQPGKHETWEQREQRLRWTKAEIYERAPKWVFTEADRRRVAEIDAALAEYEQIAADRQSAAKASASRPASSLSQPTTTAQSFLQANEPVKAYTGETHGERKKRLTTLWDYYNNASPRLLTAADQKRMTQIANALAEYGVSVSSLTKSADHVQASPPKAYTGTADRSANATQAAPGAQAPATWGAAGAASAATAGATSGATAHADSTSMGAQSTTSTSATAAQTRKEQGLTRYYHLQPDFTVTTEANATRYNGEVLRDLNGNPVKARSGADVSTYYHTVNGLKGREVTPYQDPAAQRRTSSTGTRASASGMGFTTAYDELVHAAARKHGVRPELIFAMIAQESRFNPRAVSRAGARGLMQLMPGTAAELGLRGTDVYDPAKNIDAGVRYLAKQLKAFGGNEQLALAAYNAGPGNVRKYGRAIPPFRETQKYVKIVLGNAGKYRLNSAADAPAGQPATAQPATPAPAVDAQTRKEQGMARYDRLRPQFHVTTEDNATRYNGEVLRDLDGNPVKAQPGADVSTYYHTVNGLIGRVVTPYQDPTAQRSAAGAPAGQPATAQPATAQPATPAPAAAAQTRKEQGLTRYYHLQPDFTVTTAANATRYNGEVLRDLNGNPVKARSGADVSAYYHTVNGLLGKVVTPYQDPTAKWNTSLTGSESTASAATNRSGSTNSGKRSLVTTTERVTIPVAAWNSELGKGKIRITAPDHRLNPEALRRLEPAIRELVRRGYTVHIGSANRSYAEQMRLYNAWRAGKLPAPAAHPDGNPPHLTGGALDISITKGGVSSITASRYTDWKNGNISRAELAMSKELQSVMALSGWSRWKVEPWHFEFGTRSWVRANGAPSFGQIRDKMVDY